MKSENQNKGQINIILQRKENSLNKLNISKRKIKVQINWTENKQNWVKQTEENININQGLKKLDKAGQNKSKWR